MYSAKPPHRPSPRSGGFDSIVYDYAAPLDKDLAIRVAHRFRLEKTDPSKAVSTVKKPIVYYVDRAAPDKILDRRPVAMPEHGERVALLPDVFRRAVPHKADTDIADPLRCRAHETLPSGPAARRCRTVARARQS